MQELSASEAIMQCAKCNHDLSACECSDFVERMLELSQHPNFVFGWGSSMFDNPRMQQAIGMAAADIEQMRRTVPRTAVVQLEGLVSARLAALGRSEEA